MLGWEVQSQIATVVLLGLVALAPIYVAFLTMLVWSLTATIAYCWARERGLPDLLSIQRPSIEGGRNSAMREAAGSLVKVWCAGLQNLLFARFARFLISEANVSRRARCLRLGVLGLGMTLFGVSTAEHLLRRAGFQGGELVRLGLLGPFLNVPYRLFLSAAVMHAAISLVSAMQPSVIA